MVAEACNHRGSASHNLHDYLW